jgi:hypothetical protein
VRFIKDGKPWVRGDWRRLTPWQRIKRRISLLGGSYVHPGGSIELDIDEKAGVNPGDSEKLQDAKITSYIRQHSEQPKWVKWSFFIIGTGVGVMLCKYFGW